MSKSPVYIGAGSAELSVQSALNMVQDGEDSASYLETIADWVHLSDGTTVVDRITGVDSLKYSAKEYAQGDNASTGGSSKDYAQYTGGSVRGETGDHSAKAWSVGGTGVTTTLGKGAAKQWATTTGAYVDTADYSAKEYAIGTTVAVGSAKDWAVLPENSVVDGGTGYSSLHWATKAAADLVLTNADVVTTAGYVDAFDDTYLGSHTTAVREVGANVGKDNDGDPLDDGALYYDTTLEVMKVWNDTGSAWKQLTPTTSEQTNIDTVIANPLATNIGLVAAIDDKVTEVAAIDGDVTTVANITAGDVSKVAVITTGDVSKVAVITTGDVSKVAAITTGDVSKVAVVDGEVALVAAVDGEIVLLGTANMTHPTTGHLAYLGTAAMANTTDGYLKVLGNATVTADMALLGLAPVITDMDLLGATGVIDDMETCSNNIADINNFADIYQINDFSPSAPTLDGGGNAIAEGDLAYDSTANRLKYYDGTSFVDTTTSTEVTTAADNSAVAMSIALG